MNTCMTDLPTAAVLGNIRLVSRHQLCPLHPRIAPSASGAADSRTLRLIEDKNLLTLTRRPMLF